MVKTNVLVSGATGWLGREILNVLSEDNFEKLHLNLISSKNDEVFIKGNRFEIKSFESYDNKSEINNYFDFAFLTKNKLKIIGPEKYKEINLEIIYNSMKLIKRICPKTVVLSSSGAIYNIKKTTKDEILYSDLKKKQEELIIKACSESGSNLIISRIFNLSGRGIPHESDFALSDLIIKGIRGIDLIINSNYLVTRRYSDITQLLMLLVEMANRGQNCVFDSGGAKIELRALAKTIIKELKSKSKVVCSESNFEPEQDEYFSNSYLYENLLKQILGEDSLTIERQIQNTKNYLMNVI